jgi:hypothetical protein
MISHKFALEKASQASVDGNYMEGICFSLLAIALSDGIRNNPDLQIDHADHHANLAELESIVQLASNFFTKPDDRAFSELQAVLANWEYRKNH